MNLFNKHPKFWILMIGIFIGVSIAVHFPLSSNQEKKEDHEENAKCQPTEQESSRIRLKGFKLIAPLLRCEDKFPTKTRESTRAKKEVEKFLLEANKLNVVKNVSVHYENPDSGDWFTISPEEKYSPASLFKVVVMTAILRKEELNHGFLESQITFKGPVTKPEFYPPAKSLDVGKSYKISELLEQAIIYSDNDAESLLSSQITDKEYLDAFENLSLENPITQNENSITAQDFVDILETIYNTGYISNISSEKAYEILSRTDFKKGIRAGIPPFISSATKFGDRYYPDSQEKQLHECGLVYAPHHPYFLCVMTRGDNFEKLEKVIARISEIVYSNIGQEKTDHSKGKDD